MAYRNGWTNGARGALGGLAITALATTVSGQEQLVEKTGATPDGQLGVSLVALDDVDGDTLPDWAAGAPGHSTIDNNVGRVRICRGADGATIRTLVGQSLGDDFGRGLARVGDVDGDQVNDLLVGAPEIVSTGGHDGGAGYVELYSGATGALIRHINGDLPDDRFGIAVLGIEDIDGDQIADFCVGAANSTLGGEGSGMVRAYSGSTGDVLWTAAGTEAKAYIGNSLAALGDLDDDGIGEVLSGAPGYDGAAADSGAVFVLSGATGAVVSVVPGVESDESFGGAVIGLGDLDQDGYDDYAVGAVEAGPSAGRVEVISGKNATVIHAFAGTTSSEAFGSSLGNGGDIDGDGVAELIVGAARDKNQGYYAGRVSVFSGADGAEIGRAYGSEGESFGWAVAGVGDVDGDGRSNFVAGGIGADQDGLVRLFAVDWPMPPSTYCQARINSQGCKAGMSSSGTPTASGPDDFHVTMDQVLNQRFGMFTWGTAAKNAWLNGGTNCVTSPKVRTKLSESGGSPPSTADCSGVIDFHFSHAYMAQKGLMAGTAIYVQGWYRDGAQVFYQTGLSDGLIAFIAP